MESASRFDAFISYAHADCGAIAPAIQKGLQSIGRSWYELARNLNIFRDEYNLKATPGLWSEIDAALRKSDYFIFFASPLAANSKWVKDEVKLWLDLHYTKKNGLSKIFIVLTQGQLEWDYLENDFNWDKTNCLPKEQFSRRFTEIPEWIDLRPYVKQSDNGNDIDAKAAGFVIALTKIIGGITGKEPWQVESAERRSQRLARAVRYTAAGLLLALLIVIFFLYRDALQARVSAERQRDSAVENLKHYNEEQLDRLIRNGYILIDADENSLARAAFKSADSIISDKQMSSVAQIINRKKEVDSVLSKLH